MGEHSGGCSDDAGRERVFDDGADGGAFRAVFEESFDAMVIADDEGHYVEANPAACELFGLGREALLGRSIADFAAEGFDFEGAWRSFADGKNERGLFPLVRSDGERRTVEYSATREILPGRHLSILRDVTEREANQERLRRQRDELDTLNRINELVRETIDDVVEARTRGTIERTVVETIADSELYAFALVGERDRTDGGIAVRASAGVDDDWLHRLDALDPAVAKRGPGAASIRTDRIQHLEAADLDDLPEAARSIVRDGGARALLVAPLSFGSVGYGFLATGASRLGAFGEREIEGFSALANAVGFAINAVESKLALSSDAATVLEIDVTDPGTPLARLADATGGTVAVEAVLPLDAESTLVYARPPPGLDVELHALSEEAVEIERVRRIERSGDGSILEVVGDLRTPVHALRDLGTRARRAEVDSDGTWHLVVELPPRRNVRDVVDSLAASYPGVTLQSKAHDGDRADPEESTEATARLTDRQRTVLAAAYRSGYYDWPRRGSSAEEVAATLDVAPQTVLEHLRKAERVVMDDLFEGD